MSARFQELDWRRTPMGEISLRRRWDPVFEREVHEIKLDDDFLMSSLFTHAEVELARLALARLARTWAPASGSQDSAGGLRDSGGGPWNSGGGPWDSGGGPWDSAGGPWDSAGGLWDVVVGGLGLGYTAQSALAQPRVGSLLVVEALDAVIDWHRQELIPAGAELVADHRCRLVHGDFFAMAAAGGFDPDRPGRRYHAIIVDIDHSPEHLLHPAHGAFYRPAGLRHLAEHLHPGGVFALWSNDPPDSGFTGALSDVFTDVAVEVVRFPNPLLGRESSNTVYLASAA